MWHTNTYIAIAGLVENNRNDLIMPNKAFD